jgi:hypothetical protein
MQPVENEKYQIVLYTGDNGAATIEVLLKDESMGYH